MNTEKTIEEINGSLSYVMQHLDRLPPGNLTHHKNACQGAIRDVQNILRLDGKDIIWYLAEKIINSGKVNIKAVLTHEFPLEETEKAILVVKEGKCGKVIIKV